MSVVEGVLRAIESGGNHTGGTQFSVSTSGTKLGRDVAIKVLPRR